MEREPGLETYSSQRIFRRAETEGVYTLSPKHVAEIRQESVLVPDFQGAEKGLFTPAFE